MGLLIKNTSATNESANSLLKAIIIITRIVSFNSKIVINIITSTSIIITIKASTIIQ